jgi:nitrous oxide reductase accessory protein NosL
MKHATLLLSSAFLIGVVAACSPNGDEGGPESLEAVAFTDHECAACGMLVRDQSSPRGQLVHRDGTRGYFCSVSDMITYMEAPSPHGRVRAAFVEAMDPAADPLTFDPAPRPWVPVEEATYVLDVPKERVMGTPILVYSSRPEAEAIADSTGGNVTGWAGAQKAATAALYEEEM